MLGAGRNVGRLVGSNKELLFTSNPYCCTRHNHPMLAAMVVELKRNGVLGLDHDLLNFEALALLENRVGPPRAGDRLLEAEGIIPQLFQLADNALYILYPLLVCHQKRIARIVRIPSQRDRSFRLKMTADSEVS